MSRSSSIFARRVGLWLPPALLLVAGLFYVVREWNASRASGGSLGRRLESAAKDLAAATTERDRWATLQEELERNRRDVATLYDERFSTEAGRFTDQIREIKRLAEHAGLDPREISYPEEQIAAYGISRRSFVFNVEGSYANLRMFLHLIELSPSFVSVDEIKLRERTGRGINVSLRLSTFFADADSDPDDVRSLARGGRSS